MNFFKRLYKSPNFWPLVVIIFFVLLACRTLIFEKGYFNMHDDLQMMRQLEMEKCFKDGQIPCRWVPDMGYGYGFPLFNFYPPLPYLVGQVFRVMQFSFVDTAKLTFALSILFSGLAMFYLAKEFFGKWGGVLSSIFYIWAPYHSVDVYVRGAMDEAWAWIWFPLIFLFSYKLIGEKEKSSKWIIFLAISWAGLLLSHNLMVMIFTPVFAGWCLMFWIKDRNWRKFFQLLFSGISALSLSAFFTLPAIFEQKYIHVNTLTEGYYNYIAHFATIGQLLFSRFWGYGPSVFGPNDGLSFQIGFAHWILSLLVAALSLLAIFRIGKNRIDKKVLFVILYSVAFGWFAAFMTHQNSTFIWQKIPLLAFVQFPWRFLTLVVFGFSFAAGGIVLFLSKRTAMLVGALLVGFLVIFNWNYFLPQGGRMGALTDAQKFSGVAWNLQRTAGIYDYLPLTAKQNPKDPQTALAEVVDGRGSIIDSSEGTNWGQFTVDLGKDSVVRIDLFAFPNWRINVDGKTVSSYVPNTENYGRMFVDIPSGKHSVYLKLIDTPIRTIGNYLSLLAWILVFSFPLWRRRLSL